ncbi:MAG: DUF2157 domain-containing protein [Flavobacteriales bacterium]|nr:DUF2157 domain-containing protein [Flavobacteriales bacterium]
MSNTINKELTTLIEADVINIATAVKIQDFYKLKSGQSQNRLVIMFGILGAMLMGMGTILIIAHNWDELSKLTRTVIAFVPLLLGQAIAAFTMFRKPESVAWREAATTFLFFAIGASISLVSQIYNIQGDMGDFLQTWAILCLPLVYLLRSSVGSLLYIIGISWYATEVGWTYGNANETYWYWLMFLAILPHYYMLYKRQPNSNFMTFHNWVVPLSLLFTLSTLSNGMEELMFVAYISMFGIFYIIGTNTFFKTQKSRNNGYLTIGALGTSSLLLSLSFTDWFWGDLSRNLTPWSQISSSPEGIAIIVSTVIAGAMLFYFNRQKTLLAIKPISFVFVLFVPTFILGFYAPLVSVIIVNLMILILGLLTINNGAKKDNLGIMNYGLIILTGLITCRFFDSDISFVLRGVLFLIMGLGFFVTNFWMLNKRKNLNHAA